MVLAYMKPLFKVGDLDILPEYLWSYQGPTDSVFTLKFKMLPHLESVDKILNCVH